jgi:hypothetical protein
MIRVSTNLQTDTNTYQAQYTISMEDVAAQGYSSGQEAYDAVTTTMDTALSDGSFTKTLQATASANGNTDYMYSSSNEAVYDDPTITATPVSSGSDDPLDNTAVIAGGVAGLVILGVIIGLVYWKYCRKTANIESSLKMPSNPTGGAEASGAEGSAEARVEADGTDPVNATADTSESLNPMAEAANNA